MTLVARLLLFFLATLALVLIGFSLTLYLLARTHLYRQLDDRLEATLSTLAAAAEIQPHGVEWDVRQRLLPVDSSGSTPIQWVVQDGQGHKIDGSKDTVAQLLTDALNPPPPMNPASFPPFQGVGQDHIGEITWHGESWRMQHRRLSGSDEERPSRGPADEPSKSYPGLVLGVAASTAPIRSTLQALALALTTLGLGLWVAAALVGRRLCRRALLPLTRMAATARTITAAGLDQRLADAGTRDELTDLGNAFNHLLANLQESFERQHRFTGDAAHQLRTPLTALIGQIDVALRRDRPAEEYQRVLTLLHKQSSHLRHIVEMLLFLARADAEATLPHMETLRLDGWLREHLRTRLGSAPGQNATLEVQGDGDLSVRAQAPLLGQLLDNLLENAGKYSSAGTPVLVKVWREPQAVCVAIEDQGSGIAPADLQHIFEPFYRSPEARRQGLGGVGLGLAVAKRIAEAFRGGIQVESELGKGSCFTLRLPPIGPLLHTMF